MRAKTAVAITLASLLIVPALAQLTDTEPASAPRQEENEIQPARDVILVPVQPEASGPTTDAPPASQIRGERIEADGSA